MHAIVFFPLCVYVRKIWGFITFHDNAWLLLAHLEFGKIGADAMFVDLTIRLIINIFFVVMNRKKFSDLSVRICSHTA